MATGDPYFKDETGTTTTPHEYTISTTSTPGTWEWHTGSATYRKTREIPVKPKEKTLEDVVNEEVEKIRRL